MCEPRCAFVDQPSVRSARSSCRLVTPRSASHQLLPHRPVRCAAAGLADLAVMRPPCPAPERGLLVPARGRRWPGRPRSCGPGRRSTPPRSATPGPDEPAHRTAGAAGRCAGPAPGPHPGRRQPLVHQLPLVGSQRREDAGEHPPGGGRSVDPLPQRAQQHPRLGQGLDSADDPRQRPAEPVQRHHHDHDHVTSAGVVQQPGEAGTVVPGGRTACR